MKEIRGFFIFFPRAVLAFFMKSATIIKGAPSVTAQGI